MNTDERRALKLLLEQGCQVDEGEFRAWCNKRARKELENPLQISELWLAQRSERSDIVWQKKL